jgi:D-alanyl-D-alanine carboxypeptidase
MTQMHTTVEAGRPDRRYGLGIMWIKDSCDGYWGHGGDVPGTQTRNAVNDDGSRLVVLALTTQFADDTSGPVGERATRLIEDTLC